MRFALSVAAAACSLLFSFSGVAAHPHVWIRSKSVVIYDSGGHVAAIRHAWTFDEAYSAYAVQGFEKGADGQLSPTKMAELAKLNVESLAESGFFTVARANGTKLGFEMPTRYSTRFENGALTLDFELPVKSVARSDRTLVLEVYDPTFFVDFALADGDDAVRLEGAPRGCALNVSRPKPPDPAKQQNLTESFFSALTASSDYGAQLSSRVLVACP